jgi:hypothetical protein
MEPYMNKTLTSVVVMAALSLPALPAFAQRPERGGGHQSGGAAHQQGGGGDGGRAVERGNGGGGPARAHSGPQAEARTYSAPQPRESSGPQAPSRAYAGPQPRAYSGPQAQPRSYGGSPSRAYAGPQSRSYEYRADERRAVPRPGPSMRYDADRRYAAPRSYAYGAPYRARPNFARPYARFYSRPSDGRSYRPFYFSRPYYSFRPWMDIGFGLWLGYSVPYPYGYLGSYRPRVYGYVDANDYGYGYNQPLSVYGGVSFDIQPSDADVFVDGEYAGTVSMFVPNGEPLTLTPGTHQIAVQHEGYRAMEWDVTIEPGQVIPYRGEMQQY